jgi:hypothetical protein
MKILLLDAADDPLSGPWIGQRWDAVFDLARSGWAACERWTKVFGCPVKPIDALREGNSQIRQVRELLRLGLGHLVDEEGLDWWELTAILVHQPLESLVLLKKFVDELARGAEVFITRDGFEARALRILLDVRLHVISSAKAGSDRGFRHYLDRLRRLPNAQILEILGDKYDTGYRVRRRLHRRPRRQPKPVVLLPSSYVNVSLLGAGYARLLPETNFLLVCTRRSGRMRELPRNVEQTWLASYAAETDEGERLDLLDRWASVKKEIVAAPELAMLARLGFMDDFPGRFADGLAIRNAWRRVLEGEPVEAVLCGDDTNPYTHIPLLLAHKRGLPTIACHHGGLDGRYLFKTSHADVILAKGRMERDYLVETCSLNPAVVEIGAPAGRLDLGDALARKGECIVFFSEPYEMSAGRTEEIYRDLLPGLAALAARNGKKLVVKLHPSENLRDRQQLTEKVLTREEMGAIEWITGRLAAELLQRAWFGVTALSSVAMDCAVHGVPCFVCDWLDLWPYGYVAQYRKFGVGIGLSAPEEIARIPEILAGWRPDPRIADDCWHALAPRRFEELLTARRNVRPPMALESEPAK